MYLEVTPSGGMHWRMKFRIQAILNKIHTMFFKFHTL